MLRARKGEWAGSASHANGAFLRKESRLQGVASELKHHFALAKARLALVTCCRASSKGILIVLLEFPCAGPCNGCRSEA